MNREYRTIHSNALGRQMEMLVYGTSGKPMVVFPSQEGRFFDYENFGMIDTLAPFIQSGKIQVYCIDSIDHESWFARTNPVERVKRANDYDRAVKEDVIPHIMNDGHEGAGVIAHGCSFGAFHTANFALRQPEAFDSGIALSGCYNIEFAMQGFYSNEMHPHNPMRYSADLKGKDIVEKLKNNLLIVCSGQGAWEEWTGEAIHMCDNLSAAGVPVLLDLWGYDVNHDWPWWKKMIIYFLGKFDRAGFLTSKHRMTTEQSRNFLHNFHSI